jgi:hypothetical protein
MTDWLEWAYKKSDWFDPTVARADEMLGVRRHEQDENEKRIKYYAYR